MSAQSTDTPLALVTGASGAIGGTIAALLAGRGWSVIGTYCQNRSTSTPVQWARFDGVTGDGAEELRSALQRVRLPLRAVFCCIGEPSSKRPITETEVAEFSDVYAANALSFIRTWQIVWDRARTDRTSVLALGSDAAVSVRAGNGPYSAAKAALNALALTLAKEEQEYGVRVNVIASSLVDSPLAEKILARKGVTDRQSYYADLPWGRPLTIGEVARVAVDVACAPHWQYATGQVFGLSATRA